MTLNGPQSMVSAATIRSVDMIVWGLERMTSLFSTLSVDGTNLLSCMTLDVEHLHSTCHIKHPLLSTKEYCRDLGNTMKESTKRLSASTVYSAGRQRGRVVRAPDSKSGGHGFESRSDHLAGVVSRWTLVQLLGHACK